MKFDQIKSFKGLYFQENTFDLPAGALESAENVIIEDTNTISKIRGQYDYYESADPIVGLTSFDNFLVAFYTKSVGYLQDTGTEPNLTGSNTAISFDTPVDISFTEVERPKFAQSNGNLYFTSDDGILKLGSVEDSIFQAGAPPALDLFGSYDIGTSANWWDISTSDPTGKTVGYRVLFGYTDPNDNLILGAPSGIFTINNPVVEGSGTSAGAGPYTITVTSISHGLTTGMNLQMLGAASWTTDDNAEGFFSITVLTADTFTYDVTNDPGPTGTIQYAFAMETALSFTVPSQISDNIQTGWFYRLYRSDQQLISVGVQSDYKLIVENTLTQDELDTKVVNYNDNNAELFKGELLYTNQNSGEGELQANFRPPLCTSLALYQDHMFYANCVNRHLVQFAVTAPEDLVDNFSYLEVTIGSFSNRYVAKSSPGNQEVSAVLSDSGGDVSFAYTAHGIPSTGPSTIFVNSNNGTLASGTYYVLYIDADNFKIAETFADWQASTAITYAAAGSPTEALFSILTQPYGAVAGAVWVRENNVVTVTEVGHGLSQGLVIYVDNSAGGTPNVSDNLYTVTSVIDSDNFTFDEVDLDSLGGGQTLTYDTINSVFYADSSVGTPAEQRRDTANYLVRAINRDTDSLVYADYTSSPIDTPGNIRLRAKDFTDPIFLTVSDSTTQGVFFPPMAVFTTSPDQVFSANPSQINVLYFSKLQEPEAVPIVNFIPVGSANSEILEVHTLTSSLIVLKEDGVFRLTGDNPSNFVVSLLDSTIITVGRYSSVTFANQIALLSNQGICLVSDTSVQIISRQIENVIQPSTTLADLPAVSVGFSYDIERLYKLTTLQPDGTVITLNYNILTNTWTSSHDNFFTAALGPDNRMYQVNTVQGTISRERKDNLKTDFTNNNHDIIVIDVSNDPEIVIQSTSYDIQYGDLISKDGKVNIVQTVVQDSPGIFTVTFFGQSNLADADSLIIYEAFSSTVKLAPYTAGDVGILKQFSQLQIHSRNRAATALDVSFSSDSYEDSRVQEWVAANPGTQWGKFKWGQGAWGSPQSNSLDLGTLPSSICRLYVSRDAQRSTYFQPIIVNRIAGDKLDIQAINVAVQTYGERVAT